MFQKHNNTILFCSSVKHIITQWHNTTYIGLKINLIYKGEIVLLPVHEKNEKVTVE